jgi:hypothetical protein
MNRRQNKRAFVFASASSVPMVCYAVFLVWLGGLLLAGPSFCVAVATPVPTPIVTKALTTIANSDVKSVGPVTVVVDADSKIQITAKKQYLRAPGYRFSEDPETFRPFPSGKDSVSIEGSEGVNLIEVQLLWCQNGCKGPPPDEYPASSCPEQTKDENGVVTSPPCTIDVIYYRSRDLELADNQLIPAFILSQNGLLVSATLIQLSKEISFPTFTINGVSLKQLFEDYKTDANVKPTSKADTFAARSGWQSVFDFHFEVYPASESCSPNGNDTDKEAIDSERPLPKHLRELAKFSKDNGVVVDPPKVFDVFTLRQMLSGTAAQLAGIAGFNPLSINAAVGNLQGVTTENSYLAAQVTSLATPTVSSTIANGTNGSNTFANSLGVNGSGTNSISTLTCPAGTLPSLGTSGVPACVPLQTAVGTSGTSTGVGNTSGGTSTLANQGGTLGTTLTNSTGGAAGSTSNNSTTTTSGGQSGVIAATPVYNALPAPTNIGVSAQDILTEQVQLNSQITTLRLALQGALSDQYLTRQGKATGTRQQTTLGFNISLDPPQRYKHALAEVKIWVYQEAGADNGIKVVNLLPAAKTYNVAKVTSSQKAFGAGVVIDPVNVGAAGGKSKSRLYLAKDTDTVALQYSIDKFKRGAQLGTWKEGAAPTGRTPIEHVSDVPKEIGAWQVAGAACADDPGPLLSGSTSPNPPNPLVFGWQFRPVLGAAYVQSGQRQVFAQLALPVSLAQQYSPLVYIQTRWRAYDAKKQVAGAVYKDSCSITRDPDPIQVINPLEVKQVAIDDMGGGILKVSAHGKFLAQGFSVMSGPNLITPTTFDGKEIEFFANAATLLMADDLKVVDENGKSTLLGVKAVVEGEDDDSCNLVEAKMRAIPRPDGNSLVEANISTGSRYIKTIDKAPSPLFLIGSQVYGLHETPFLESPSDACQQPYQQVVTCTFHFLAGTDALHAAQNFKVRDLAWSRPGKFGKIDFDPSFTSLTLLATNPPTPQDNSAPSSSASGTSQGNPAVTAHGTLSNTNSKSTETKPPTLSPPPIYTLTGNDLLANLASSGHWNCTATHANCLDVYQGLSRFALTNENFQVASKTTAVITFTPASDNPMLTPTPTLQIDENNKVSLSDTNLGAKFFYTTDGTTPTTDPLQSQYYEGPFVLSAKTTLKVIAATADHLPSTVAIAKVIAKPNDAKHLDIIVVPTVTGTASQLAYKSYRFVWHPLSGDAVEWDLPVPQQTPAAVTASSILNQSDSTEITFSNVQVSPTLPITFTYDGVLLTTNPIFKYDAAAMTLKVLITSSMTAKPGHKELLLNGFTVSPGSSTPKAVQIELPFDVTKR